MEAQRTTAHFARTPIDAIFSSDLRRAWETAGHLAAPHGLAVRAEPELREWANDETLFPGRVMDPTQGAQE
ncbi:MAG: histidine phosphatase family protein [Caldilineaceae bacterium]|nr:histidine phosphatase family protein [Caldilineaceae bacterium]